MSGPEGQSTDNIIKQIAKDIQLFIDLSLHESEEVRDKWLPMVLENPGVVCWDKKQCSKTDCPAHFEKGGRCWLIAGTMCGGEVQGDFAIKYKNCTKCDVYQEVVLKNPVSELYEGVVTLLHSFLIQKEKLKTMAVKDLLTGLYNKNYFNETISREIDEAKRYDRRLSFLMIDIDNFKQINDEYGHLHGDGIIRECADILKKSVRTSDMVCRFGGDEFVIVASETECDGADSIVNRINSTLDEWNASYASNGYRLSLSIGCAMWADGKALDEVISEADLTMYENKRSKKA